MFFNELETEKNTLLLQISGATETTGKDQLSAVKILVIQRAIKFQLQNKDKNGFCFTNQRIPWGAYK